MQHHLVKDMDWMRASQLTPIVFTDMLERIANLTGATYLQTEKEFWRRIASLEARYGVEVFLTGQVFASDDADQALIQTKEFWEDFLQTALARTQEELSK